MKLFDKTLVCISKDDFKETYQYAGPGFYINVYVYKTLIVKTMSYCLWSQNESVHIADSNPTLSVSKIENDIGARLLYDYSIAAIYELSLMRDLTIILDDLTLETVNKTNYRLNRMKKKYVGQILRSNYKYPAKILCKKDADDGLWGEHVTISQDDTLLVINVGKEVRYPPDEEEYFLQLLHMKQGESVPMKIKVYFSSVKALEKFTKEFKSD